MWVLYIFWILTPDQIYYLQISLHIQSEKAMATHSSTLAWKISRMEEPGRLQSMGSWRVGHEWSDLAAAAASHSVGSLFIFLVVSFTVQSFLFEVVPFAFFTFVFLARGDRSKKILLRLLLKSILLMFSSRSFIVLGLKFKSLIHFEFIFVYGLRKWFSFILLQVAVQFSQHRLLKRLYILASFTC